MVITKVSRKVEIAGITPHPNERWMKQVARNVTMDEWGFSVIAGILSMTVTPNTVSHFGISSNPVMSKHCLCVANSYSCSNRRLKKSITM